MRKSKHIKVKLNNLLLIIFVMASSYSFGQKHGVIEGYVRDANTQEILPYASLYFDGTAIGSISDEHGFYRLMPNKSGSYLLKVKFVGYQDTSYTVNITAGQVTSQDVELALFSFMGEEATITAQAYGQVKAINTQIAAKTIKHVVSEEKIRELPDANAAEALSRLPGVSVVRSGGEATDVKIRGVGAKSVFVNGMRMAGGLNSIASSMIGGIELSKAFMADQDADVLGGSIDFKMREAKPGFKKDIWLRTGYNDFTNSFKMQDASALLSNRFFDNKLGVMLSLSYDRKDRGRDVFSSDYQSIGSSENSEQIIPVQLTSVSLDHIENMNNRYGVTLYTDYKLNFGKLYYQGFLSLLDSETLTSSNRYGGTVLYYTSSNYTKKTRNMMHGLGGEFSLGGWDIDFGASYSGTSDEVPLTLSYSAQNAGGMTETNSVDSTTTVEEYLALGVHDMGLTNAVNTSYGQSESYKNELAYKINIQKNFNIGRKASGYVKFGGKYRDIDRLNEYHGVSGSFRLDSYDKLCYPAAERMPDFGWTYIPNGSMGHEAFASDQEVQDFSMFGAKTYFYPDFDKVAYVESNLHDLMTDRVTNYIGNYNSREKLYATYIMGGLDIGTFITFTPGVRYEHTTYNTTATYLKHTESNGPLANQGELRDTTNVTSLDNLFPMVHLKIKPTSWFDIRLSYTETESRPGYSSKSARYYQNSNNDINEGNPELKAQSNYNYDLYFSFYGNKLGLLTVGVFYKKMEDQIMNYQVRIIDPEEYGLGESYANRLLTKPINNQWPGYIQGLEIEWQTQLSYLPAPFDGIVLNSNVTFMQSETKYPFYSFETVTIPEPPYRVTQGKHDSRVNTIIGMPDMTANVALGYEKGGFSGRISTYYQSSTITQAQASDISTDVDKAELLRLDMQLSQKIKKVKGLTFYLNINNLTNNPDMQVLTHYTDRITREERYGVSGDIGARYRF